MTDYEEDLVRNIREYGWQTISVFDPEELQPNFSYSAGFTDTLGCPEFIIFSLTASHMHNLLSMIFERLKSGESVYDGKSWDGLLVDYDCVSRAVDPSNIVREYFNSAMWYRRHMGVEGPVEAYQIVWPDVPHGRFPWDPGCNPEVRDLQPALYLPATTT